MTDNHQYETPSAGTLDWHEPLNRNFERIDTDVEIRDTDDARSNYAAKSGAKFLATDTGAVYIGDGGNWVQLGTIDSGGASGGTDIEAELIAGNIVVLARDLSSPEVVTPSGTNTPIQDAYDVLGANDGGEIRLPPGRISTPGNIRPYENTTMTGFGAEVTELDITEQTADGIVFDRDSGTPDVSLGGFALNGPGGTDPTGVAIHHTNRDTMNLRIGRLLFWGWNNSVYRVDQGVGPFQCRHEQMIVYDCDAGAEDGLFEFRSYYGPANWFGTIAVYPIPDSSGENSTVFYSRGGTQTVDYLTMGGSTGYAIDQTWDSVIEFGNVHYEPVGQVAESSAIVRLRGHGTATIDTVKHVTGAPDYVYELDYDSYLGNAPNRKILGPYIELGQEASLGETIVNLAHPTDPTAPSLYQGSPDDVAVTHSQGSTGGFRALGTAGTGF
ncbi:hypothetical protein [Haloarcula halophila]|uniref:hypothetical protein n=1 Tax=Haloarcula TaxID=2237 RepID=UPI0023E43E68|nr:hypothetical protein [Halomicroarcula sp. DFY41]